MAYDDDVLSPTKVFKIVGVLVVLVLAVFLLMGLVASVDQDKIMVIQSPWSGKLSFYTNGGVQWQGFGKVTYYHKRSQLNFLLPRVKDEDDGSITIRFNDGGHAQVSGAISWDMPLDQKQLTTLYQKYGTEEAIERDLVRRVVEKSVYMTGPLMSSKESYAERRNDLLGLMEDQIANGVYKTQTTETKQPDPMTGEMKTVRIVNLVDEGGGKYARQESSPLRDFGVRTYNLSLNNVKYDDTVERQIQQQQAATMQVQTAMANAKQAEQAAITAAKNGEAEAMKAKWEQEVIKAKAVTEAQQKLEVAKLQADAAEQERLAMVRRGQGEGEYKRAVMVADGGLKQKIDALVQINQSYAQALEKAGWPTPTTVVGQGGAAGAGSAATLIELLTAKTARDLGLDMSVAGAENTRKK